MNTIHAYRTATLLAAIFATTAAAATIPFTEEFTTDNADWRDAVGFSPVEWVPGGGPDGSSYVSDTFNFAASQVEDAPAIFRGQDEYGTSGSSGGAFVGMWLEEGVGTYSMFVRHDAPFPISIFVRFSGPNNFPAGVALEFVPVFPNTWTEITIPIDPDNPQFVTFEGSDFQTAFANTGHIQIGPFVDANLAGQNIDVRFDLDKVAIAPVPVSGPPVPAASAYATISMALILAIAATAALKRRTTLTA